MTHCCVCQHLRVLGSTSCFVANENYNCGNVMFWKARLLTFFGRHKPFSYYDYLEDFRRIELFLCTFSVHSRAWKRRFHYYALFLKKAFSAHCNSQRKIASKENCVFTFHPRRAFFTRLGFVNEFSLVLQCNRKVFQKSSFTVKIVVFWAIE